MENKVLTVGIIGMGIGKYHADAVMRTENARLTWICDVDEGVLAKMQENYQAPHCLYRLS